MNGVIGYIIYGLFVIGMWEITKEAIKHISRDFAKRSRNEK